MISRDGFVHQYMSQPGQHVITPGALVIRKAAGPNNNKLITVVMPIARPNSSPAPGGAPFYLYGPMNTGSQRPNGTLLRGGSHSLSPSKPRVEMDPTDPTTWQRSYRFS